MKKRTEGEFQFRFGRMVKGVNSLLLEEDQISDSQNMQPGYHGWKQRKGSVELTTSAIASGLKFKTLMHYRDLKGNTNAIMAHVYDGVNGERIMKQTTLPASTHAGTSWTAMYSLSSSCEDVQFGLVAGNLILANDKEFLCWKGESYFPTGIWKYIDSATAYIDYYDEMLDGDTSTVMPLDDFTTDDAVFLVAPMPLNKITPTIAAYNSNIASLALYKWNGSWTEISGVTDGTEAPHAVLEDDAFDDNSFDTERWTTDVGSGAVNEQNDRLELTSDGAAWADKANIYQASVTGDFVIRVKLYNLSGISANYEQAGIFVQLDDTHYVKLCRFYSSGQKHQYTHCNGTTSSVEAANSSDPIWLKLIRSGSTITAYWNNTGLNDSYTQLSQPGTPWSYSGAVNVGLYAITSGGSQFTVHYNDFTVSKASLSQDGDIEWTAATDEVKTFVEGIAGYAYKLTWDGALDSEVEISAVTVHSPMNTMRSLWSGQYMIPSGFYLYDGTDHTDYALYVGNSVESQYADLSSVGTGDKIYVGFPWRTNRIVFYPASDGKNANNVSVTAVKYFKSDGSWTSVGTVTDTSETNNAMFSQKGYLEWADPGYQNEKMTTIGGDDVPLFWYEITVDSTLSDPTYIYHVKAVPLDRDPEACYGCFGWKRRAWQIAPKNRENQVRFSAENIIDIWGGTDSGYIEFGERPLKAAGPFYNETVLYADTEMWMLQGNSPSNFGRLRLSAQIGIAAPASLVMIETGVEIGESMKNVLVWQFYDGFWMFDGVRIMKISSPDIDTFFDADHDDYINPSYLDKTRGSYDHETQCVMWTVYSGSAATSPTKVIVMHFPSMWYGIFDYGTDVGPMCRVYNSKYYTVAGGDSDGKLYQINSGVTDDVGGSATAVDAFVISRDMFLSYSDGLKQRLLSLWTESQTAGGLIEIDEYPDGSDTPQEVTKTGMRWLGKLFGIIQQPLKNWSNQKTTKFRIRNRSKNARMHLLGFSTTVDRGRADE